MTQRAASKTTEIDQVLSSLELETEECAIVQSSDEAARWLVIRLPDKCFAMGIRQILTALAKRVKC